MGISIVVCTFNRAALLNLAIDSIFKQEYFPANFELIIIDNNSSDNTFEICEKYIGSKISVRYFKELAQGLSHARNRGYHEALYDYIGYLDDDAQADKAWLKEAESIIQEKNPDAFGGPIFPYYLTAKPDWFIDDYEIRLDYDKTGWLPEKNWLSGSNMFFKKDVLTYFSGFRTDLGMNGEKFCYGEETELLNRLKLNKNSIYYSLDLMVTHHVPAFKMDLGYQMFYSFENSITHFKIHGKSKKLPLEAIGKELNQNLFEVYNILNDFVIAKKKEPTESFEEVFMKRLYSKFHWIGFLMEQYSYNEKRYSKFPDWFLNVSISKIIFILKNLLKKSKW